MNRDSKVASPGWTPVVGSLSVLLTLEFWLHMLVPFFRQNVRFPLWPTGAIVELLLSLLLASLAAIRGSRIWWLSALCAAGTLGFLIFLFGG